VSTQPSPKLEAQTYSGALSGRLFINGEWCPSSSGEIIDDLNPSSNESFAVVHQAGQTDIEKALDAAEKSFGEWSKFTPSAREKILLAAAEVMEAQREKISDILRDETGSVFKKSQFEINFAIEILKTAAGEARRITGETFPANEDGMVSMTMRSPLGIVAAIAPFNFPLLLALKKVAFALAAGNTVILKPADETPISNLVIGEVFDRAGLPSGVLNVVPGPAAEIGEILMADSRVKLLAFTGSTRVGRLLATKAARNLKQCTLELGGKNPLIVLDDANVDHAVNVATHSIFVHQGQICMAGSRILLQSNIAAEFTEKFVAKAKSLRLGDPRDKNMDLGPLIRRSQVDVVLGHIQEAVEKGATLLTGGTSQDNFVEPTILKGVTPQMTLYGEESFGPVTYLSEFENDDDAIQLANDTAYGLSSAVITKDLFRAFKFAREIQSGMVHLNGSTIYDDPIAPFGGTKMSGMGREGGKFAIEEMTELKWITIRQEHGSYWF